MTALDAIADWPVPTAAAAVVGPSGIVAESGDTRRWDTCHPRRTREPDKPLTRRPPSVGKSKEPWELKDLRKTCATYHDEHVPESSVEIPGHSVGGITYRHYAHRAPLAFRAIMTLPQPTAFQALVKGSGSECPCCRRRYADAG